MKKKQTSHSNPLPASTDKEFWGEGADIHHMTKEQVEAQKSGALSDAQARGEARLRELEKRGVIRLPKK